MDFFECCHTCPATERHPGCHATCGTYKKQRLLLDAQNEAIRKASASVYVSKTNGTFYSAGTKKKH